MWRFARVLVAVTSLLTVSFIARTAHASVGNAAADAAYVQRMLFGMPLGEFSARAHLHVGPDGISGNTWFDWTSDLCSAPLVGSTGRTFNFIEPCRRHDFGYRNTQLLERRYGGAGQYWNAASRLHIDRQLLADAMAHCASRWFFERPSCYWWAITFYRAVRVAGGP